MRPCSALPRRSAWRWYRQYRARKALRAAVTDGATDHLIDILVPDGMGGGFHVDYLLLTLRGVVVIDLRDVQGNIFGGDQMAEWTVMDGPRRFTFTNPQSALYDRIAAVKARHRRCAGRGTHRLHAPRALSQGTAQVDADARRAAGGVPGQLSSARPPDSAGRFCEAWQRLKEAVKPSNMVDMR